MKTQLKFGSAIVVALGIYSAAFAAPTAQIKADASSVNSACAQEAQTAGCTGEVVGKGLMKCLATYKKPTNLSSIHRLARTRSKRSGATGRLPSDKL